MDILRIHPQEDCWEVYLKDGTIWRVTREYVTRLSNKDYGNFLKYLGKITKYYWTNHDELRENGFNQRML